MWPLVTVYIEGLRMRVTYDIVTWKLTFSDEFDGQGHESGR